MSAIAAILAILVPSPAKVAIEFRADEVADTKIANQQALVSATSSAKSCSSNLFFSVAISFLR